MNNQHINSDQISLFDQDKLNKNIYCYSKDDNFMFGSLRYLFAAVKQLFCKGIETWFGLTIRKSIISGGKDDAII